MKKIIENKIAARVLNKALSSGADFAELYVQNMVTSVVNVNYKRVDNVLTKLEGGAGLRLMQGVKQVYGFTSDLDEENLLRLAEKLSASLDSERLFEVKEFSEVKNPAAHAPEVGFDEVSTEDKIKYLQAAESAMYAVSPLIVNCDLNIMCIDEFVEIFTVEDGKARVVRDNRVRTRLIAQAVASRDGAFEVGFFSPGLGCGLELMANVDFVHGAEKAAKTAVALLDAPECPAGKMPVIIGNKFGGVLFHEACGHPLEGTAISHNLSPFAGKLGQKIASDVVTAIDDGTVDHGWGSANFDDEGNPVTRNVLIENGILKSYMVDRFDGRRMNMRSTGACRRESYKFLPTTRMTNTFIAAGKSTPEEIIAATEYGIYCVSFNGGSVDPTTDKFNFTSSETYLIKNGKIDKLVKAATLTGFGYEILPKIDMVGNDCMLSAGWCGAASGLIPAAVGQPTLRVSEITVGGKG